MHKQLNQLKDHQNRSKQIIILFILDILFLVLSLIAVVIQTPYSQAIILICLSLDIVFIIHTASCSVKNLILVQNLEDYFFHKSYGISTLKIHQFHKLMAENLFRYYFQPIINAKNGEIFAYEALMRTDPESIDMLPIEILDLAAKEGRLYDIEKYTFQNTLKLMKEFSIEFETKKLFINSISSHLLSSDDFSKLYDEYKELFSSIIIEITESTTLSETTLSKLHRRLEDAKCQLALDDYGTGYSTEASLLNLNPDYVKIDRSVLRYINIDSKKQNLVTNLVDFARKNNIKIIAEGIENYEEFEYVIGIGVDYIQGFYTGRPDQHLLNKIPEDLMQKIQRINYKKFSENSSKSIYETNGEKEITPSEISTDQYYSMIVYEEALTLKGSPDTVSAMSFVIPDNHKCVLTLDNINLCNEERPSIFLSSNSSVTINLIGDNKIMNDGIRVCETASLTIVGDGNLFIHADRTNRVGIGGSDSQTYGNITLASTGNIKVVSGGNISVGIGGGQNPLNSLIRLISGNIQVDTIGYTSVCVGSILGNSRVEIGNACRLKTKAEGTKAVGVGSIQGAVDIVSSGSIEIRCDGRTAVGLGAVDEGSGAIAIRGGESTIRFSSHTGTGIGAVNGKMNVNFEDGNFLLHGEGSELLGLGDHYGNSQIKISGGVLAMQLFATSSILTGNLPQKIIIDSGNIQCDFPEDTILVNSYGSPLVSHIITNSDEFKHIVETVAYSYEYKASYSSRYPFIKVYLPEYSTFN